MNKGDLINLLKQRAVSKGQRQILASGIESDVYVNCKEISLHGPSLWSMSQLLAEDLKKREPSLTHVAGVSVGGDPIVAGLIAYAHREMNWNLKALLVRTKAKDHGASAGRAVEGDKPAGGQKIWLVEDVISSGGSAENAARHMGREGYQLAGILSLVDREMGGRQKLSDTLRVPVVSLVTISELLTTVV